MKMACRLNRFSCAHTKHKFFTQSNYSIYIPLHSIDDIKCLHWFLWEHNVLPCFTFGKGAFRVLATVAIRVSCRVDPFEADAWSWLGPYNTR